MPSMAAMVASSRSEGLRDSQNFYRREKGREERHVTSSALTAVLG